MISLAVGILGWLVYREWDVLRTYDWHIRWGPAAIGFGFYTLAIWLAAWVWAKIMDGLGCPLPVRKHFRYLCLSNLVKRIPGTIWYIAGRSQMYRQHGVPVHITSLASGIELVVSVMAGILVNLVFAIPLMLRYQLGLWGQIGLLALGIILVQPRILGWLLHRFRVEARQIPYQNILQWIFVHALVWIVGGCLLYSIVNTFISTEIAHLGYIIGCWSLVGVLSTVLLFSPSNWGVTELGLSFLLAPIMPASIAVIVAISVRVLTILFEIIWALISSGWPTDNPRVVQ
jgi:hypothetical protein